MSRPEQHERHSHAHAHAHAHLFSRVCRFPGTDAAYTLLTEALDTEMMADAILHIVTRPETHNQAYNISNGDCYRWSEVRF